MKYFPPALLVLAATVAGCKGMDVSKVEVPDWVPRPTPKASVPHATERPIVRVVCIWQPADGTGMDKKPARGFAGQILFFAAGSEKPVVVNGDVKVLVFDDYSANRKDHAKPVHEFDFKTRAWNNFLKKTQFGPAYQVFIPYTRKGHHQANCAVHLKFTQHGQPGRDGKPRNAAPVFSDLINVTLRGTPMPHQSSYAKKPHGKTQLDSKSLIHSKAADFLKRYREQQAKKDGVRPASNEVAVRSRPEPGRLRSAPIGHIENGNLKSFDAPTTDARVARMQAIMKQIQAEQAAKRNAPPQSDTQPTFRLSSTNRTAPAAAPSTPHQHPLDW